MQAGIFERIMDARWKELSRYPSGDLLNRFNGDVGTIEPRRHQDDCREQANARERTD